MCLNPVYIGSEIYSCGKCDECKLSQELTLGYYGLANLTKYDKVASITLTYDDEHIPLEINGISVDYERKTYKVVNELPNRFVNYISHSSLLHIRQAWDSRDKRFPYVIEQGDIKILNEIRDYSFDGYFDDIPADSLYQAHFIVAVGNLSHLQQWFKNLRQYARRMLGITNNAFKYTAVLEYGPKTCRPHFHICLFFNDTHDNKFSQLIQFMCQPKTFCFRDVDGIYHNLSGWKYGTQCTCNIISCETPTQDTLRIARYVAKYGKKSDKGIHTFEKLHLVPTFRRVTSKGYFNAGIELAKKTLMYDIDINQYPFMIDDDTNTDYREFIKDFPCIWEDARKIARRMKEKQFVKSSDSSVKIPWDAVRRALSKQVESISDYEIRFGFRKLTDDEFTTFTYLQSSMQSSFFNLFEYLGVDSFKTYDSFFREINFNISDNENNLFIYKQTIPIYGKLVSKSSLLWMCVKSILSIELDDSTEREFQEWIQGLGIKDTDESRFRFKELCDSHRHSLLQNIIKNNVAGYDEPTNLV